MALEALAALASIGMSIFGAASANSAAAANKKQINDQRAYARKVAKLQLQDQIDGYEYLKDSIEIARTNYEAEKDYLKATRIQEWKQSNDIRVKRYNSEVDSYNASVEAFEDSIDFNRISAGVARRDSQRVLQEQYDAIGFEADNLRLELQSQRETDRLDLKGLRTSDRQSKRRGRIESSKVKQELDAVRQQYNRGSEELAALTDSARAETSEKLRIQRYESLLEEGKARATGQAGRSALKVQSSIAAQDALAQQSIVDALTSNEYMTSIEKRKLVDNLDNARRSARTSVREINELIRTGVEERNIQRLGITLKEAQRARQMGLNIEQLGASRKSAKAQFNADISQIQLDQYAANVAAQNNLLTKPEKPDPLPKPIMPPDPIIQEPLRPNFEAIKKINKQAGKAIPGGYTPGALGTLTHVLGGIQQASALLANRPKNPVTPTPTPTLPTTPTTPTNYQIPQAATPITNPSN